MPTPHGRSPGWSCPWVSTRSSTLECDARALKSVIALRNAEQAMWEIRQYGAAVEDFSAAAMPATHAAFVEFGRRAP